MYRRRIASRTGEIGADRPFWGWCTSLVALTLCSTLLTGCAGIRLQSTGIAGPSWQQREAIRLQEEGDDLGDRVEEAEETGGKRGRGFGILIGFAGVAVAFLLVGDDDEESEELTFGSAPTAGEGFREHPLRYRGVVHY